MFAVAMFATVEGDQAHCDLRMTFAEAAVAKPTAREAMETLLHGAVDAATGKETPAGCLGLNGALACSQENEAIRQELTIGYNEDRIDALRKKGIV
jgi:hypothetical protein